MRSSGILLPIFSLPSPLKYGDIGDEAYKFIDKLSAAGQKYWQVLPIGPVNEEFCPYQSKSGFAGEPLLISVPVSDFPEGGSSPSMSDIRAVKSEALQSKFQEFWVEMHAGTIEASIKRDGFAAFCNDHSAWLDDYALYEALSDRYGTGDWSCWDEEIRDREAKALEQCCINLEYEISFYKWTQYEFMRQWGALREYAHKKGVELIGDIPYYAAFESADCWTDPQLFKLDDSKRPLFEAGAPPDSFASEGQCWGNPVYDWDAHKEQKYKWWIDRIRQQLSYFDVLRIDHMRGFESYYVIPEDTKKPKDGHWEKGPGMEFFNAVSDELGSCRFIAEDLGYMTEEVKDLMREAGFPGMKILQFAFDTSEENVYLPFNYDTDNSVIYTGTHDNDTTLGWYEKAEDWKKDFVTWYLRERSDVSVAGDGRLDPKQAVKGLVELAHSSRCDICIIPMQDYLLAGSEARINTPGEAKGNWHWQMDEDAFTQRLADEIREITLRYGR